MAGQWKIEKDPWDEELSVVLKKQAIRLIMPDFEDDQTEEFDGFRLIPPSEIPAVDLYYEDSTQRSLDRLTAILKSCPTE